MRAGDFEECLFRLIPQRIGTKPMTPHKEIPVQVTPVSQETQVAVALEPSLRRGLVMQILMMH
jgi:hypothetical protein